MKVEETKLAVRVQPNARQTQLMGYTDGVLQVRIAAPPQQGKANRELVKFLAERLDLPKSAVIVDKGAGARNKLVIIRGLTREQVLEKTSLP